MSSLFIVILISIGVVILLVRVSLVVPALALIGLLGCLLPIVLLLVLVGCEVVRVVLLLLLFLALVWNPSSYFSPPYFLSSCSPWAYLQRWPSLHFPFMKLTQREVL